MIRRFLVIIFAGILLAGCITSQPESGTLQLTSSPAGAEIYLDNQYRGTTPATITEVVPGNHTLEFRLNGYRSWKSAVTVPPGTSNYFASLTAQPGSQQGTDIRPAETAMSPADVTVRISNERMIIGDKNTFFGTATGTSSVTLTLFGPGSYANGKILDTIKPDTLENWRYTWDPGAKIQPGTYTLLVRDAEETVSDRITFMAIGNGIVSVTTSSYAVGRGETVTISGRCTTGAPAVRLVLSGPERFSGGVDLGTFPVMADQTWSFRYFADNTMPTGIYTLSASDVPETASGSSQFTVGFAS
jgi:hypothetical protein